MKKALIITALILITFTLMAPGPPEKAEKLKIDEEGWDVQPFFEISDYTYGVEIEGIDCKFGMATAGEHANFTINFTFSGVKYDENEWDDGWTETVYANFEKLPGAEKDADGYIQLNTISVSWNGDDDGEGYFVQEMDIGLVAPGGNVQSTVPSYIFMDSVDIVGVSFNACGGDISCP
jgi:hypothetical protein